MKNLLRVLFATLLLTVVLTSAAVHAVTYPPDMITYYEDNAIVKLGAEIYIFYGGNDNLRKEIALNEILPVYHLNSSCEYEETGKVKVSAYAGKNYLEVSVIEGIVKWGDIVKKKGLSFLIGYVPEGTIKCLQK